MVQTPTKPLSLQEFLNLPETKPASEYINGEVIQKPMPQGKHSILQRELIFALTLAFKESSKGQAFPELRCTFGGRSIVPDVSVFRSERIPHDESGRVKNSFELAPDWTIEILSLGQSQSRVIRNILHCLDHGTEMGWLLDPEEQLIFLYGIDKSVQVLEEASLPIPVPAFAEQVRIRVGEIFDWLTV